MDGVAHAHKRHATIGEAWLEEYVAAYKLVQLWALGSQDNSMRNQRLPVVILERDVDVSLQRRTVSGRGGNGNNSSSRRRVKNSSNHTGSSRDTAAAADEHEAPHERCSAHEVKRKDAVMGCAPLPSTRA